MFSCFGRLGVPPSAPRKSWTLLPSNTVILGHWDVNIDVWLSLKAICSSALAWWWSLPMDMTSCPACKVQVKHLVQSLDACFVGYFFKGAICFLSRSRSFFGVSSVSEWFSGGSLSERQSAGLCPAVRLPPQRFNRALFRKVSPCPGKTLQCYFHVVLVTSLLWSPTPDVQCFWSHKDGNSQPLVRTVPMVCFR